MVDPSGVPTVGAAMPDPPVPPPVPKGRLDRYFHISARGSSTRTEVIAGTTTFLTMAYIVLVNPSILGAAGMPIAGVAAATCFAAAFASILMGMFSNVPLALAPGMGLNAYFTYTVVLTLGVPWPVALACVFISGVVFLLLTLAGLRQMIVASIPPHLLAAVAGGIGLFIAFIGLRNAKIVVNSEPTGVTLGDLTAPEPLLALLGLLIIAALSIWRVRGAMLIGIVATTLVAALAGMIAVNDQPYSLAALGETAFALDFGGLFSGQYGIGLLEIVFVFLFVDLFDGIGTLVAVTKRAGLVKPDGSIPRLNRILLTDATATMVGAMAGTSTVTNYVESAAGVQAGGRTGLTAVVTGLLFLVAMFFAPYAQLVPIAAAAPALILVGGLMMAPLVEIAWDDPLDAIPAFITLAMIPLTFSIANGLAFGLTAHALLKILRGQVMLRRDWLLLVLALLFVLRFAFLSGG